MRNTILTLLLLLGTQTAVAATVTVRATATILEPVKISFQSQNRDYAAIDASKVLKIQSARKLQYEVSHKRSDVCLFKNTRATDHKLELAQAGCETVTINFN